jgi:lipopolysaccharide transport protein LptA
VTVVADSAVVRHPISEANRAPVSGGKANYSGNVRAWQENEFVRADQLELDRGERILLAVGNAQSAYYQLEREVEKGRKQIVPVFASADRIRYNDGSRKTLYEGSVRIRQGTDTIDAANAEATMDEEHRLLEMVATGQVVVTQPDRVARGERLLYNFKDEQARLTGRPATLEDRLQQVLTSSDQLTLSLRDGRFDAADEPGGRKRVRTTHRIK